MTTTDATRASPAEEPVDRNATGDDHLLPALGLLGLFMLSVLGFGALLIAVFAELPLPVLAVTAVAWLVTALVAAPLMLYDARNVRERAVAEGFRFDPFWTAAALLVIYPLGLPVYLVTRLQGSYLATMAVDTDAMDLGDEIEFGLRDLVNPTAGGVPSVWPAMMLLFLWFVVLAGDGWLVVALLLGEASVIVAGIVVLAIGRLLATPFLLLDVYVVAKTGHFDRTEAAGLAAVTTVLFPLALVGYLPYRLHATYG